MNDPARTATQHRIPGSGQGAAGPAVPSMLDRVTGALVAVLVVEEAFATASRPAGVWTNQVVAGGSAADALLWVAHDYATGEMRLNGHASITPQPPVWVLPAAVVHPDKTDREAEVRALAASGGLPKPSISSCVHYGELVADVVAGNFNELPSAGAGGRQRATSELPAPVEIDSPAVAHGAALWAAVTSEPIDAVLDTLDPVGLAVRAAVAGVIGLRDGFASLPPSYHRKPQRTASCLALARQLVHARRCNEVAQ
jgi:hypothetical protein